MCFDLHDIFSWDIDYFVRVYFISQVIDPSMNYDIPEGTHLRWLWDVLNFACFDTLPRHPTSNVRICHNYGFEIILAYLLPTMVSTVELSGVAIKTIKLTKLITRYIILLINGETWLS